MTRAQRAMAAAELANLQVGRPSEKAQICAISDAQAATLLNVSERSVETAKAVKPRRSPRSPKRSRPARCRLPRPPPASPSWRRTRKTSGSPATSGCAPSDLLFWCSNIAADGAFRQSRDTTAEATTLAELGISRDQSSKRQQLAAVRKYAASLSPSLLRSAPVIASGPSGPLAFSAWLVLRSRGGNFPPWIFVGHLAGLGLLLGVDQSHHPFRLRLRLIERRATTLHHRDHRPIGEHRLPRRSAEARVTRRRVERKAGRGDSKREAGARWEQALAALFHRSGWTQDQLAKKEGVSRPYLDKMLRFGRFLEFDPIGSKPQNLTEGRFRDYWARTDKAGTERVRFREVAKWG